MKLHLPLNLRAALAAAVSVVAFATVSAGSAAYGAVTYAGDALITALRDDANHVYNDGAGTFYILTRDNTLDISLTICLESLSDYQDIHDYKGSSPLVIWAYDNNPDLPYGIADYKTNDGEKCITGYWNGTAWTTAGTAQLTYLQENYSVPGDDNKHYVTLNITNNPSASSNQVQVTATNPSTGVTSSVYTGNGLSASIFKENNPHVESVYVNTLYVTSFTLNSASVLDVSTFEPPKDYSIPFVSQRADAPETSVGRIMFIGDSITHGEWDMTWRWQLFKTFVDNGIENEIVGPRKGFSHTTKDGETVVYTSEYTDDAKSKFSYRGVTSDNVHYAQSSGRTRNIISGNAVSEQIMDAEGNVLITTNSGASYGGNSADKVGNKYDCNTYAMMIGTNDLLSDTAASGETAANYAAIMSNLLGGTTEGTVNPDGSYSYTWTPGAANGGHMGTILDELNMTEGDTFYVLAVPTWALSGNHNDDTDHSTVGDYNGFLKTWTENYNANHAATVKFVDINKGLVDKTSSCEFFSNKAFFNNHNDGLHPTEQGSLIIAGNLAQAMGIGGRTGGFSRADAGTPDTVWNTESQQTTYSLTSGSERTTAGADFFTREGGYTIDFNANFGDGSANGWLDAEKDHSRAQIITPSLVSNALSITVGDGAMGGTLKLSEGYILWHDSNGDNLLYCRDNSEISSDNLRIAYNVGSTEDNIVSGYYVWLGDMLIGQGLNGTAGVANGISFSVSGTGTGTVKGLTFSNTAYAPTTEGAFYASAISTPHFNLPPMASHDNTAVSSGIDWTTGVTEITNQNGVNNTRYFVDGIAKVKLTDLDGWFAAGACTATGNVQALVSGATTGYNAFAWQSGTLTGDVTMQFVNSTIASGSYSGQYASIAGSYGGASITGTFSAYVDNCTLEGDMVGGALNGSGSIGAVKFVVNSGTIEGSIYGGSKTAGTVGNGVADSEGNFSDTVVTITINGGHITGSVDAGGPAGTVNGNAEIIINGGIIDHDVTDGSVIDENGSVTRRANQGKTTVTVQSNKAYIGGNITADTVNLMNVEDSGTSDGFDKYAGTITATNLVLDHYTADALGATLNVSGALTTKNGTNTVVSENASIGTLTLQADTQLTFHGKLSLTNGLQLTNSGTSVVLNGGYSVTTGVEQNNLYDLVLGSDTSATINCAYTTSRLLGHASGSELTFGEHAIATVGGIYGSDSVGSNGTLTINAGAEVTSGGNVKSNILNLNGSLTVQGDLGVNTLNMSGGSLTVGEGTATFTTDVTVGKLAGSGSLNVQGADSSLSLGGTEAACAVNITTGTLDLTGSTGALNVGELSLDTIVFDSTHVGTADTPLITATGIAPVIASDGIKFEQDMESGLLDAGNYTLLGLTNGTVSPDMVDLADATLSAYQTGGYAVKLEVVDGSTVQLVVREDDTRTWNTSETTLEDALGNTVLNPDGSDHTLELSGEEVYKSLDGVSYVHVDGDATIDLTEASPESDRGLVVNNLSGDGVSTLSIKGDGDDRVTLSTQQGFTPEQTAKLSLSGLKATLEGDLSLKDLDMVKSSLDAKNNTLRVENLSGDKDSTLSGTVIVTGSNRFLGTYGGNTSVELEEGAEQTLNASDGLTVTGSGGTANLEVSKNSSITAIKTTGTNVTFTNEGVNTLVLTETSAMDGGTLALEVSLKKVSDHLLGEQVYTATTNSALKLSGVAIEVTMTDTDEVSELSTSSTDTDLVLFRISDHVDSTIDDCLLTIHDSALLDKYFKNIRLVQGSINVVGTRRTNYYGDKFTGLSANGAAGVGFAGLVLSYVDPQNTYKDGDLAKVLNALDNMAPGANPAADKLGAAFAGAGTAAMGAALAGDMDRQLRAVRNRTTTMGVSGDYGSDDLPVFNAWINAEGDYRTLDQDGTMAGYTLNSWGGTVGVDVDFSPHFTAGLAATAMYGDLEADSAETKAEGDMDSYYVSLFARYADKAWVHTFVASIGMADFTMDRTVTCGAEGSYTTTGDTSGVSFGLMYEAGYVIALDEEGTACLQPVANITYKHTAVDGYNESGDDAALEVGNQTSDSVTIGVGARFQAAVGETVYNRSSLLELRALAKVEAGDRSSSADITLPDVPGAAGTVESAEADAFGIELGAGVTVPLEPNAGALFFDISAELRGSYTNVNGTFGYRINF